jgi:hypothetical protein
MIIHGIQNHVHLALTCRLRVRQEQRDDAVGKTEESPTEKGSLP